MLHVVLFWALEVGGVGLTAVTGVNMCIETLTLMTSLDEEFGGFIGCMAGCDECSLPQFYTLNRHVLQDDAPHVQQLLSRAWFALPSLSIISKL